MTAIQPDYGMNLCMIVVLASVVFAWLGVLLWPIIFTGNAASMDKAATRIPAYPDGPTPLPLLGNIFSFSALMKNPDTELLNLAARYGKMCMLWFGNNPVLIISSPSVSKELLDKVRHERQLRETYLV